MLFLLLVLHKIESIRENFLVGLEKSFGINFLESIEGNVDMLFEIDINFCLMDDYFKG
jgi:hypothetical protein